MKKLLSFRFILTLINISVLNVMLINISLAGNGGFDTFLKLFPHCSLPMTVNYSSSDFLIAYYVPDDSLQSSDSIPYYDHVLSGDSVSIIPRELVDRFLTPEGKVNELKSGAEESETVYYAIGKFNVNKQVIGLVCRKHFMLDTRSQDEKFLITINRHGKLVDGMMVAAAIYAGSGILGDGFRVPWYPDVKSTISENMQILFSDGINNNIRCEIRSDGSIVKAHQYQH